jgi:hypothetical protein
MLRTEAFVKRLELWAGWLYTCRQRWWVSLRLGNPPAFYVHA